MIKFKGTMYIGEVVEEKDFFLLKTVSLNFERFYSIKIPVKSGLILKKRSTIFISGEIESIDSFLNFKSDYELEVNPEKIIVPSFSIKEEVISFFKEGAGDFNTIKLSSFEDYFIYMKKNKENNQILGDIFEKEDLIVSKTFYLDWNDSNKEKEEFSSYIF